MSYNSNRLPAIKQKAGNMGLVTSDFKDLSFKFPENFKLIFPSASSGSRSPFIPKWKSRSIKKGLSPTFSILIKQVAARLSGIDLALECSDITHLQFNVSILKGLFITMNMPLAAQYTGQIEEMARGNRFREAKRLLLEIKKMIAQSIQYSKTAGN